MGIQFWSMTGVGIIAFIILYYRKVINPHKFIQENDKYFQFLRESDFNFLVKVKYGEKKDPDEIFQKRLRNGFFGIIITIFALFSNLTFLHVLGAIVVGYIIFKSGYSSLKGYYKKRMSDIDATLPYYLKTLEILVQHYTVPVALGVSIEQAPEIFKSGLRDLVAKINAGDATVDPYMEFAKEYSVRDSMRMMRLLYRLSLGTEENKQEQILMFSKTVSALQNKAREQKYKERLQKMESKTLVMLGVTGGATMIVLIIAMSQMMSI